MTVYNKIWYVLNNNRVNIPPGSIMIGKQYRGDGMHLYEKDGLYYFYHNGKLELFTGRVETRLEFLVPTEGGT